MIGVRKNDILKIKRGVQPTFLYSKKNMEKKNAVRLKKNR